MVCLADFRHSADTFDPCESLVEGILVCGEDIHETLSSLRVLCDGDGGTCLFLDLLDGLAALSDNGADEV